MIVDKHKFKIMNNDLPTKLVSRVLIIRGYQFYRIGIQSQYIEFILSLSYLINRSIKILYMVQNAPDLYQSHTDSKQNIMYQQQRTQRSNSTSAKKNLIAPAECPTEKKDSGDYDEIKSRTSNHKKDYITLGICAMKKKVQSKPMKQILSRLSQCKEIKILEMWDLLETNFQTWPKVQALICFHSEGFPFVQAWRYVKKHKPLLINNLEKQQLLWDRTVVYDILRRIRVPVAKNFMIFRDKNYIDGLQLRGNGPIFTQNQPEQETVALPKIIKRLNEANRNSDHKTNQEKKQNGESNSNLAETWHKQDQIKMIPSTFSVPVNNIQPPKKQFLQEDSFVRNDSSSVDKHKRSKVNRSVSLLMDLQEEITPEALKQSRKSKRSQNRDEQSLSKNSLAFRKRAQIDIIETNNKFPNALRNFNQKRQKDIDEFTVQQVDDGLLIKSKKTDKVQKLKKPFVQKPFDSENHHICIYYPESMGGGRKILFRKVKNTSSQYQSNESHIRTDGNYIYEEFLLTNAFDIKVYTIGPYYMYAEARRSPVLDGVVDRDQSGKQKRFPVILTPQEKFLCSKIVQQFEQDICGFDLLRAEGKSYVCDVNGWSFVKGNPKYWDDCAIILKRKILKRFFPHLLNLENSKYERFSNNEKNEYRPPMNRLSTKNQQLRSIVSIFRHGDRSPKLKMKLKTKDPRFLQFFKNVKKDKSEIKIKDAKSLTKILDITNQIIVEIGDVHKAEFKDYSQMKAVLESGGRFQGFNRKIQLKVIDRDTEPDDQGNYPVRKALMVLKWGGQLSYVGYLDSMDLGQKMRQQRYDDDHDFLSLYSSYKHDLKTYSSDEGRCIKTSAAFLKGFLNISGGGLAPIITSMVNFTKKAQKMLDCSSEQNLSLITHSIQEKLSEMMNSDEPLPQSYLKQVEQAQICKAMMNVLKEIGNPLQKLKNMHEQLSKLVQILQELQFQNWHQSNQNDVQSHEDEAPQALIIIFKRWSKLQKDFYDKQSKKFNISKIPQIYDNIRYDLKKNHVIFSHLDFKVEELHHLAKLLAYFVVPNEYGMNDMQKLSTAKRIVSALLQKILVDLLFWKNKKYEDLYWKYKESTQEDKDNWKHIRTRLYFTSASHMYSIINMITLGNDRQLLRGTPPQEADKAINQLYMSYLSHIQFRLYESMNAQENDSHRFRLQISISSEYKKTQPLKEFFIGGSQGFTIDTIQKFFENILAQKQSQIEEKVSELKDQSIFG